jgi:hypothetical protein
MSSTSSGSSARSSSLGSSATSSVSSSVGSTAQGTSPTFTGFPHPPPTGGPGGSNSPQCNDPQGCAAPPPATLYLYTFLSTLIILLLVSGGIIARSVVLRRRQQIAIANGTWAGPRRRENFSNRPRPVVFEAYIATESQNDDEERWSSLKPFSASNVAPPTKTPFPPPPASPHHVPIRRAARDQMRSILRLHNPFRSPPPPPPPPTIELPPQSSVIPSPSDKVRVALLVAMPWQEPSTPTLEEEEELPYLEFGVLDVDVVDLGKTSGVEGGSERADSGSKL